MSFDSKKLEAMRARAIADLGGGVTALLVHLGDKLGLYKAMSGAGPMSSADLAGRTNTRERYVREWLNAQAASGYVDYEPHTRKYRLSDEAAALLAREDSTCLLAGGFEVVAALFYDEARLASAFQKGVGIPYGEHEPRLFSGVERFLRPEYAANLVTHWLPSVPGLVDRLRRGAKVADVGCGRGAATMLMTRAFPLSRFFGFDAHAPSIDRARSVAADEHLHDRVHFEAVAARAFPGAGYHLITLLDCLHDMGDPVGALKHARATLAPDGVILLVEPRAGDHVEDNLTPIGRLFYGISTAVCTPASLSEDLAVGLGAQAGEARLRALSHEAGLHFRRAAESSMHAVFELHV